uniref:ROK family protein n=1 Tax=Candidatus Cryptobacteroides bacterium TaxID=3085639 RepID=UPI004025A12C
MYFVGIDLGGTVIKIGLVSDGKVLDTIRLEADSRNGLAARLDPMAGAVDELLARSGLSSASLGGIALAFPGIVDVRNARALGTNAKYDDAPGVDLKAWAGEHWNVGLAMDNDARMATVGEWLYGAGKGCGQMVMMTIGTGIGTGVVLDGRLLYGRNFCAGSLGGHIIVDYKGRRCSCGNIGCVEAQGSSFFLPRIIQELDGVSAGFAQDSDNWNFRTLFAKYRDGDPDAETVVRSCMDVWSAGIINYIHAYDPEIVVMGGGIMGSADIILPYVRKKVEAFAWQPGGKVGIVASELGDNAALLAAEYYFRK